MKKLIKDMILNIPFIRNKIHDLERYKTHTPPGHFYSPIHDVEEIKKRADKIFDFSKRDLQGIDLREKEQMELLLILLSYYKEIPFPESKATNSRYWFNNDYYSYSDGIFFYSMIRHLSPGKIIEVGSGFSSAVCLDVNEKFFNNKIECIFIEPYPDRLNEILKGFPVNYVLRKEMLQNVPLNEFRKLNANDILFIDSTHVSKVGSDVNYIFFEILPVLKPGVCIHFHDVFYPFEYPQEWIYKGIAWNEDYLLRAFLQYNHKFEIILFNTFMEEFHEKWFKENMPLCLKNTGGSIWLRKKA